MFKPIIALLFITTIFVIGTAFIPQDISESIKRGKEVYELSCQNCHMENGEGMPDVNPPLAKADYLKKPLAELINIVLKGQSDEIVVNGKKYNTLMPAMDYMDDLQIADALNFIRNSWGNKSPGTVTPAMVKALRQ
ncbi:c-type cytochrome [Limnovirga soli]|jgi:nitrite reductase (NO-forming)|uniref:C-type cytochrome n=1 Tax=Limnovirga soli TaxID=2656915 RepID=A0A8J8FHZ2_9BACT|nr:cytochrome c [Limnovirga soli]NNV57955.1 c-type cytochrome [Limnovirga soli]